MCVKCPTQILKVGQIISHAVIFKIKMNTHPIQTRDSPQVKKKQQKKHSFE